VYFAVTVTLQTPKNPGYAGVTDGAAVPTLGSVGGGGYEEVIVTLI
jgi:hypothetical protein